MSGGKTMTMRVWLNLCEDFGNFLEDWSNDCLEKLYKGRGDKNACSDYKGISL